MANHPRISGIFYHFQEFTTLASGRTVGRKIGDLPEILCKKLLVTSDKILDCIIYGPRVHGRSGATHKVEFVLFQPTVAVHLSVGREFEVAPGLSVSLISTNATKQMARISLTNPSKQKCTMRPQSVLKVSDFIPESSVLVKIVGISETAVRLSVLDRSSPIASIESKRVGAQRFFKNKKRGSGIQTIEKAKQISLAAVDFDLKFNGTLLAHTEHKAKRAFRNFAVLGNGVHWTKHDLAILETYVDYTYLAKHEAVLRFAEFIGKLAASAKMDYFPFFMSYIKGMTKAPADAFVVSDNDFLAMRPKNAGSLRKTVEQQIRSYAINTI